MIIGRGVIFSWIHSALPKMEKIVQYKCVLESGSPQK